MNLFSKQKLKKKDKQNDNIYRLLLPSFFAICICTICLSTASWAWFTSTTSTSVSSIKAAYNLSYGINNYDKLTLIDGSVTYIMDNTGTCAITLSAKDSATDGYCIINYGGVDYYTSLISKGTDTYGFTIIASEGTVITLTPKWGALPTNIGLNNIITNEADNNSNSSTTSLDDFDLIDEESSTDNQETVDDAEVQEKQDISKDGETESEEKTDEVSSNLEEEQQNIEKTENKEMEEITNSNEELLEESNKSNDCDSTTDVSNGVNESSIEENGVSQNSSLESTESANSGDNLVES